MSDRPSPAELAEIPERPVNLDAVDRLRVALTSANDTIAYLTAELVKLRAERAWQPGETAPKDGQRILALHEGDVEAFCLRWSQTWDTWQLDNGDHIDVPPAHWMPLPEAPR